MEEDIRKKGMLFLQQQRFGKKWKRVWCHLYRDSSCSISRMEFFECKDGASVEKNDKTLRKQQEHKKVIRMSDCIRVTEVEMDGCPRDTGSFLVETTEKIYVFAADRSQLDDWTHKLCEIAFPMSWTEPGGKRGSLQRGSRVDEDQGMEDNSLYSGRETVRDFRVCVRRTDASDRCRLKGDGVLRADMESLHLLDKNGDILYTWPYRYLRRFGRDKSTFSFEAGRRCDSGEGNFEFDTKQGNALFQSVEAAINLQKISLPHRQISGGGPGLSDTAQNHSVPSWTPQPQTRGPPAAKADEVYSMVTAPQNLQTFHNKDENPSQQQRPPMSRLEPPVDKILTGVKSLTLDTRGLPVPRKSQVKMISSCPLPNASPESGSNLSPGPGSNATPNPRLSPKLSSNPDPGEAYSEINVPVAAGRSAKKEKRGISNPGPCTPPLINKVQEYSLPFDMLASNVMSDILNLRQPDGSGPDPLYDSIDEMMIRNIFRNDDNVQRKVDHIYDEPEGCAAAGQEATPTVVYDDPEEMRGNAWRIMGTPSDPKGHEYPYNPRVDDYAVPKRPKRAFIAKQNTTEEEPEQTQEEEESEEEVEEEEEEEDEEQDSPYKNVTMKMV
ncbi:docking protein 2 [Austrofundulus limnaeus]|uniref:Docking protein 2 n=1 Tax=Austrofundulus limnaeus TaxID=52670 RepID=A0A2I4CE34_AUSLI|nr:PREDICTED: docking protein 2-like [Austrofundulus limnaeus]